jgi:hypothetical protein
MVLGMCQAQMYVLSHDLDPYVASWAHYVPYTSVACCLEVALPTLHSHACSVASPTVNMVHLDVHSH